MSVVVARVAVRTTDSSGVRIAVAYGAAYVHRTGELASDASERRTIKIAGIDAGSVAPAEVRSAKKGVAYTVVCRGRDIFTTRPSNSSLRVRSGSPSTICRRRPQIRHCGGASSAFPSTLRVLPNSSLGGGSPSPLSTLDALLSCRGIAVERIHTTNRRVLGQLKALPSLLSEKLRTPERFLGGL